jgi:hypothetical protein
MRSQVVWTQPKAAAPSALARLCARRALDAHNARQPAAAAFWLDRAEAHAQRAKA